MSASSLTIQQWTVILTFVSIKDLISCINSTKYFCFISESDVLAKHWLNILSFSYIATRAMSVFYQTELFRIFSRTITYKMDHLQKKAMVISIYSAQNTKYLQLFKYADCYKSLNPENQLFRKCIFADSELKINILAKDEMTIVNKNKFIQNMNKHFYLNKWWSYIYWDFFNIAGGALLKCISKHFFNPSEKQDIDLFYAFDDQTLNERKISNKKYAHLFMNKMVNNGYQVVYDEHYFCHWSVIDIAVNFESNPFQMGKFTIGEYLTPFDKTLTYEFCPSFRKFEELNDDNWVKFQFIALAEVTQFTQRPEHKDHVNIVDHNNIISNFDLDICQIRFDGNNIFCTFAFIFALSSMSCINYKMPLRANFNYNVDWRSMSRAIKYHNRGYSLLVPIEFNLDPLSIEVYEKWYAKYKDTVNPNIGYGSINRNHDFMGVLEKVKRISRDQPIEGVTPGGNAVDNLYDVYNEYKFDLFKIKDAVLKYGITNEQLYNNCIQYIDDIDPRYILTVTDGFAWLYKMISTCNIITTFQWLQKYISNQKFTERKWDLLVLASMLFAQCFYFPSTLKLMVKNIRLFRRFLIIFHWIFDYWFLIQKFKPIAKIEFLSDISQFIFWKLTSIQAVYCRFLNTKHLKIYAKNKQLFKRCILDVLQFEMRYNEETSKNKYKLTRKRKSRLRIFTNDFNQIKPSFRILAIKLLSLYLHSSKIEIQSLNRFVEFGVTFVDEPSHDFHFKMYHTYYEKWQLHQRYIVNLKKRMVHALNDMYSHVYCEYNECNINYYKHIYGLDYALLSDICYNVKFDKKYKINGRKWFKCKGCKLVYYCCRKCQKKDWQNHKTKC